MAIADFLQTLDNTRLNPTASPISFDQKAGIKRTGMGSINTPVGTIQSQTAYTTPGSTVQSILNNSKINAQDTYQNYRTGISSTLAKNVLDQSAGNVPTDQYGVVQKPSSNYQALASVNLNTVDTIGKTALQGAQDQAYWKQLKQMQDLANNYNVSTVFGASYDPAALPAGSTSDNIGAQAVAIATTAFNNKTPYVWGGNSLTNGVDCSGLVQQVYAKLGIKLPRTTYEQAKSGHVISGLQNAMPGDLIFYNTGSGDPNGIGKNSHVSIYMGNGMVIDAYNSKVGMREGSVTRAGTPSVIVRPWS